ILRSALLAFAQVDRCLIVGDALEIERDPHAESGGGTEIAVELHGRTRRGLLRKPQCRRCPTVVKRDCDSGAITDLAAFLLFYRGLAIPVLVARGWPPGRARRGGSGRARSIRRGRGNCLRRNRRRPCVR